MIMLSSPGNIKGLHNHDTEIDKANACVAEVFNPHGFEG
jgi:hypothetical protein